AAAPPAGQEGVPELEPGRLLLAAERVVLQVGLQRAVRAEHLDRAAREALTEGQVELRRAARADGRHRPAVDEALARVQLARREQAGLGALHAAEQLVHLPQR